MLLDGGYVEMERARPAYLEEHHIGEHEAQHVAVELLHMFGQIVGLIITP